MTVVCGRNPWSGMLLLKELSQPLNTKKLQGTIMNEVSIEPKYNKVEIQPCLNAVEIEVIRIHTEYEFLSLYQTTPEHKEV
jgi:hypothetical protein